MNNYSCLDYWYFFWDDFCKEVEITTNQFMALFNDDLETEIPRHAYSPVSTVDNIPKVIKRDNEVYERNKTIEMEAPALIQVPEVIQQVKTIPEVIVINNSKAAIDEFAIMTRYEDEYEIV